MEFPNFDIYSSPLVLLLIQGLVFFALIFQRYVKTRYLPNLFLSLFILLFLFERLHYSIGFLSWYDTFPNTKINYFLLPMTLALGPLLYFYIKSISNGNYRIRRIDIIHFIPFLLYLLYRMVLLGIDASMNDFSETQNGKWMSNLELAIINPLFIIASSFHLLLYIAFSIQLYYLYRSKIKQFYSNTYKLELNWVRNFLLIYLLLFLYDVFQNITDSFIMDLHWTQKWWFHFISSVAVLYFGIKGYFTKTEKLQDLNFEIDLFANEIFIKEDKKGYQSDVEKIRRFMDEVKPFLNPDLNLKELSTQLDYSSAQLSEIINTAFDLNFNDFVNTYRVEAIKRALEDNKHEHLSLVGIAYDCGFNSKATFNRVFKKLTLSSPTEYIRNLKT